MAFAAGTEILLHKNSNPVGVWIVRYAETIQTATACCESTIYWKPNTGGGDIAYCSTCREYLEPHPEGKPQGSIFGTLIEEFDRLDRFTSWVKYWTGDQDTEVEVTFGA